MSTEAVSPLRQRMIEDMVIRQFGEPRSTITSARSGSSRPFSAARRIGPSRKISGATSSTSPRSARAIPG